MQVTRRPKLEKVQKSSRLEFFRRNRPNSEDPCSRHGYVFEYGTSKIPDKSITHAGWNISFAPIVCPERVGIWRAQIASKDELSRTVLRSIFKIHVQSKEYSGEMSIPSTPMTWTYFGGHSAGLVQEAKQQIQPTWGKLCT